MSQISIPRTLVAGILGVVFAIMILLVFAVPTMTLAPSESPSSSLKVNSLTNVNSSSTTPSVFGAAEAGSFSQLSNARASSQAISNPYSLEISGILALIAVAISAGFALYFSRKITPSEMVAPDQTKDA